MVTTAPFRLPSPPPDGPAHFTRRLSRHKALAHWWTLQEDALIADADGPAIPARKGGCPARLYRGEGSPIFAPLGPRRWPVNPDQARGGTWAEARFAMEKTGIWSVVSITHTTVPGSDPWGLHFDADAPQLVQLVNATTRGQTSLRAFDPDPALRQDMDIGPGVALKAMTAAVAVLNLDRGSFRLAPDLSGGFVEGISPRMKAQAMAARAAPEARLAMGRAMAEQPLGGWFMDFLLIRGDLFALPELLADLRLYFDAVWGELAP